MAGSVGFVGLGNMGRPMALNLVKAGFELVVHDINSARLEPLVAAGATVETSPEAVAARCHRTICMVETTAQAEAGKKAGLDPGKIFEVVSVSTGNSVQFQNRVPRMLARNFAPGGTIDISYKDQELETGYAKALGVPLLMANLSQQVYQMGRAAGLNKEDGSAIIKIFERVVGVTIGSDD
jgi:3-hydroxyisobutyrate dehydrogenase-like beta-hydroxyacid dehydrogenase